MYLHFQWDFRVLKKLRRYVKCCLLPLINWAIAVIAATSGQYISEMSPPSLIEADCAQHGRVFDNQLGFCPLGSTLKPEHLFLSFSREPKFRNYYQYEVELLILSHDTSLHYQALNSLAFMPKAVSCELWLDFSSKFQTDKSFWDTETLFADSPNCTKLQNFLQLI